MSQETSTWLNQQTLIGYTEKRGNAWWYREEHQGAETNHYPRAIPVDDVRRRLFNWQAVEGEITATAVTNDGVITTRDEERKAIMRSDTGAIMGVFKSGYQPHQYGEWLVTHVESILDADLAVGSAGLLKGGAVAWVQVEMADTITAPGGVEFRPFLTAATSFDGSLSSTYLTGAQVVVCDNTLSAALGNTSARFKVKHSRNSLGRVGDVREALSIVHETADVFSAQVAALLEQKVADDQWSQFVKVYTGQGTPGASKRSQGMADRKAGELTNLYRNDLRVAPWSGTAYGVLAAVNTHVHHVQTVRNVARAERNMERAVTGGVDKLDTSTLELLATIV